ncbi:MAG: NAD(P)H-dependent glycerol-3-phosphate dehydrogenase [Desulfobacterales bacterium]|nr:NAD(P)H-dependent glycerol-3-phosphate dehydrogenase [Desulfobacterales bacterium]
MNIESTKIGVIGAGSWGTALANLLALKGFKIDLWVYEEDVLNQISKFKENITFLPNIKLSDNIYPSNDLKVVSSNKDLILLVVPSHEMRNITNNISNFVSDKTIITSASKGIENKTHLTMTGILKDTIPNIPEENLCALSGPSFAKETAKKDPTAVVVASKNEETACFVQHIFATEYFRVYTSDDVIGVELGGAVKNVIAIASGMLDGLKLGFNTRAALITRGLTEIGRLGIKLGANPQTFAGLAGIGDLLLTCTSELSRNHTVGKKIGEGKKLSEVLAEMKMVAEGVKTAKSVYNLSNKVDVVMPISHEVYRILYEDASPKDAVFNLMTRDLKQEFYI